jgi:WD40 repeat protein
MSLAFSSDGELLASGGYGSVILWDVKSRLKLLELNEHTSWVESLVVIPKTSIMASGGLGGDIILWDLETLRPLDIEPMKQGSLLWNMAFHPDGQILASGGDNGLIAIWDVRTGKLLGQLFTGHPDDVKSVTFDREGKFLASGSDDGTIILLDVNGRRMLGEPLTGHTRDVNSLIFNWDGLLLFSSSDDGTVGLWSLSLESWVDRACRVANRNLTQEEWDLFIGYEIPYECTCHNLPPGEGASSEACVDLD